MNRISSWNAQLRNSCVSEFKRLIRQMRPVQIENAIAAGRALAKLLEDGRVLLLGVDALQLERFRRRFRVHENLKGVMYSVATGKLTDAMLNERLDRYYPYYILPSGKRRYVKRCALCGKRTCRCFAVPDVKRRKAKKAARDLRILVSVRGIPVVQIPNRRNA